MNSSGTCGRSFKSTISIYVTSHLREMRGSYPNHQWVYCGSAAKNHPSELNDIPQHHERLENRRWSELSAAYKIWKEGPRTDIVGMCHYRRFFCFKQQEANPIIPIKRSDLDYLMNLDLESYIINILDKRTIITPLFYNLKSPIAIHYARMHDWKDYSRGVYACIRSFPHLAPFIVAQLFSRRLYPFSIFIMNWNDFDELCHVWFDSLIDVSKKTPWPREDSYQDRDMAYVAERLTDAWIRYKRFRGYRIIQYPLYFVSD